MFSTSDGEIEELGLEFQIATRLTSWVAVDESRVVKGPAREQLIPQELPYGTTAGAFGLRGGAQAEEGDLLFGADMATLPRGMPAPLAQARPMAPPSAAAYSAPPPGMVGGAGGGGAPRRSRSVTDKSEAMPESRSASFDFGEEGPTEDDFDSEVATGETERDKSQLRSMRPALARSEPLPPPPPSKSIDRGGKVSPPAQLGQPAQPAKPQPELMLPTQPKFPPLEQRAELERKRKQRMMIAIAIVIAAILALLWWLIG